MVAVRSQTEFALVYLCDLSQRRLEITAGFVLHASILDEAGEMVFGASTFWPGALVAFQLSYLVYFVLEPKFCELA